jgi:putative DNA-invertase from lambdoid prophage Rac
VTGVGSVGRPHAELARARKIDAILVTELSRWGRSTQDLLHTLNDLHGWKVSVLAQNGQSFDLSTSSGKLLCTILAGIAEFERYAESTVMRSPRREEVARRGFLAYVTPHN